ncbi:MAG: hypothetical protein HYX26_09040 [Acidobacteriales bacterium]|nr:hypothetical protein [Terriglobales bacterium]
MHCTEAAAKDKKNPGAWEFASAALWPGVALLVCGLFYREIRKAVAAVATRMADPSSRVSFVLGKAVRVELNPGEEIEEENRP